MPSSGESNRQRVVVVTGGARGIGAGIALELGRTGCYVITLDPMLTLDGTSPLGESGPTTAERIVEAGGSARASNASVTDRAALETLFAEIVAEFGALDAVINVAGITRSTRFAAGIEPDWAAVVHVHLDGYLNILGAALPLMA
jgi:NAD(P)-dependent dehydrogenase (short-subunit alcohol dehydrogenase family)